MSNIFIGIGLATITTSQFVFGIYFTILAAKSGGKIAFLGYGKFISFREAQPFRYGCICAARPLPPAPLDVYYLCIFSQHRTLEIVYTAISLVYGVWNIYNLS